MKYNKFISKLVICTLTIICLFTFVSLNLKISNVKVNADNTCDYILRLSNEGTIYKNNFWDENKLDNVEGLSYKNGVWEMNNFHFTTSASTALFFESASTIYLIGDNSITSTFAGDELSYGITVGETSSSQNLIIRGTGKLVVQSGGDGTNGSIGIKVNNLTIDGAEVEFHAGLHNSNKTGIAVNAGKIFIKNYGNLLMDSGVIQGQDTPYDTIVTGCGEINIDNEDEYTAIGGNDATTAEKVTRYYGYDWAYTVNYLKYKFLNFRTHRIIYKVENNTITIGCDKIHDPECQRINSLTLNIENSSSYSGNAVTANFSDTELTAWLEANLPEPTISYIAKEGSSLTDYKAINAGKYTALATFDILGESYAVQKDFEINKIVVTTPVADNTKFIANGNAQTYNIAENDAYTISGNRTQTEVGTYVLIASLKDKVNTQWSNGNTDDLIFLFEIEAEKIEPDQPINNTNVGPAIVITIISTILVAYIALFIVWFVSGKNLNFLIKSFEIISKIFKK